MTGLAGEKEPWGRGGGSTEFDIVVLCFMTGCVSGVFHDWLYHRCVS